VGVLIPSFQNPQRKATWNKEFDKTQLNTNTIAMKNYFHLIKHIKILLLWGMYFVGNVSYAQNLGDYRTIGSGAWYSPIIWQSFDGLYWNASPAPPSGSMQHIVISAGDSVWLQNNTSYSLAKKYSNRRYFKHSGQV